MHKIQRLLIILVTTILVFSGCKPKNNRVKDNVAYEYYDNGRIKTEAGVKNDTLLNGICKNYTPDGYLESVYTYVDGKKEGPGVTYYNNGKLRTKVSFRNNKLNGTVRMYYKSGELYRVTNYREGKAEGMRISYYKNGKVMSEVPYKDDYPGLGIREYTQDGKQIPDLLPKILITADNRLALGNTYILKISLSKNEPSTTFYIGDLVDNKYIHSGLWPRKAANGTLDYHLEVHKGGFLMETLTISATFLTSHKSWAVVSRKYNLAIDNK